jgi:hypothetical protein
MVYRFLLTRGDTIRYGSPGSNATKPRARYVTSRLGAFPFHRTITDHIHAREANTAAPELGESLRFIRLK